ncbi:rRNA maturation RNase YbeY [Hyphobacterium sp.]|uniref:rRNA maturation RNase YbeY n=1 Tax=Hyphobacterium sp. TaxID=2004662 RepID=UPI003B526562
MTRNDLPVIDVQAGSEGWAKLDALTTLCETAIGAARQQLDQPVPGEVCIRFTDDAEMSELNARFRDRASPTNVLSFPAHRVAGGRLGDIALGRETVFREAEEKAIPVEDHVSHLVIHGFLHLQGLDHQTDTEAETMEALERAALLELGISDPYEVRT